VRNGLAALACACFVACAPIGTIPEVPMPEGGAPGVRIAPDWWRGFNDPVLDSLVARSLEASPTLESALARVDAARARAGIVDSAQLPSVAGVAAGTRAQASREVSPSPAGRYTAWAAGLQASWEADLWGRVRNEVAAGRSEVLSANYALDGVRLSLAAETARTYFQLRSLDAQADVARRTIVSRERSLALRERRFAGGITSELDLRQAQSELAAARAQLPDLEEARVRAEGALAVLVGLSPRELAAGMPRGNPIEAIAQPSSVPAGLPSDLLLRRPDIREAEEGLRAAQARVAAARAAWFPRLTLTSSLGGESLALADLFSGPARAWQFVGQLSAPVFNAGLTAAQVDLASSTERAAAAAYRDRVIRSFAEARAAVMAREQAAERVSARGQAVEALARQVRLASLRYDNGYSSYLEVLDAERALFAAELAFAQARAAHLGAVVDLFRALGGGWSPAGP